MDQTMLVSEQIQDGQKLVDELVRQGFVVTTACWLKRGEESSWHLYVGSPEVDQLGLGEAYRRVHPIIRQMPQPFSLDMFDVLLVSPGDPIVAGIEEFQQRQPVRLSMRYGGPPLGRLPVDVAYIYAPKS